MRDLTEEDAEIEAVLGTELDGECDPHDRDDLEEDKVEPPVAATFHESIQADIEELVSEVRKQTASFWGEDLEDFEDMVDMKMKDGKEPKGDQAGASAGVKRNELSDLKEVSFC